MVLKPREIEGPVGGTVIRNPKFVAKGLK